MYTTSFILQFSYMWILDHLPIDKQNQLVSSENVQVFETIRVCVGIKLFRSKEPLIRQMLWQILYRSILTLQLSRVQIAYSVFYLFWLDQLILGIIYRLFLPSVIVLHMLQFLTLAFSLAFLQSCILQRCFFLVNIIFLLYTVLAHLKQFWNISQIKNNVFAGNMKCFASTDYTLK